MDYSNTKAWPYQEARKIIQRNITDRPVVFQTGYGPSGLPHIGTFAEVARTSMVRRAYEDMTGLPTRLIVFSDDMDAMRKVPDNVRHPEEMAKWIGYSLSRVPDMNGRHESFAHANNWMLRDFLDRFGFEYEFMSATQAYRDGTFDAALSLMWDRYDAVRDIILPTLGEARRETYSPFMPIMPDGRVIMDHVLPMRFEPNMLTYTDPPERNGQTKFTRIHGGKTKCQWKADWALRWYALGVDYEMAGKDLIDSVTLSSKIVRAISGTPPVTMIYEMFLDEEGHKISKSKGNGLTIDQWLRYGDRDSLSAYLFREPKAAKKLFPAVVPAAVDEYWDARTRYLTQTDEQRLGNPVHHVHAGKVPPETMPVSNQLLLNLAQTAAVESKAMLHSYACRSTPMMSDALEESLGDMVNGAFNYYQDHLSGGVERREATPEERLAMKELGDRIEALEAPTRESVQFEVYEVGKAHYGKEKLRDWFKALYEVLMGQSSGPRFGDFACMFGIGQTVALLRSV
jgi:lysyl-tRNA synthetase class 1